MRCVGRVRVCICERACGGCVRACVRACVSVVCVCVCVCVCVHMGVCERERVC